MADNQYNANFYLSQATNTTISDDGSGIDTVFLTGSYPSFGSGAGYYGARIWLSGLNNSGNAYIEVKEGPPLLYRNLTIIGTIENAFGSDTVDEIIGNGADNYLQGDASDVAGGNDTIIGLTGNDTIVGGGGSDLLWGGTGNDLLIGDFDPDSQDQGNYAPGDDTLAGGEGDDTYIPGAGTNTITDTSGFDRLDYGGWVDGIEISYSLTFHRYLGLAVLRAIDARDGTSWVVAQDSFTGIEWVSGTSGDDVITLNDGGTPLYLRADGNGGHDTITGANGTDLITGGPGNDVLDPGFDWGASGPDTLIGGTGNDTYFIYKFGTSLVENANEGWDRIISELGYFELPAHFEELKLAELSTAQTGVGNAANNRLTGNAFANSLDGRAGADTMEGLGGNDIYYVDNSADVVIEKARGGNDTVRTTASWTMSAHIERLEIDTTADNVSVTGNALNNVIIGNAGADIINGGGGQDFLSGLGGNDTYYTDGLDTVVEAIGGGIDTVYSNGNFGAQSSEIEHIFLTGTGDWAVTAGNHARTVTGNSGNNYIWLGSSGTTVSGGLGNDTVVNGSGNDVINGNAGIDTLTTLSSVAVRVNLSLAVAQDTGNGTDVITGFENAEGGLLADLLIGNTAANVLSGMDGNDTLQGGAGDDLLRGQEGNDSLSGDAGNDTLDGGQGNDILRAGAGNDVIDGGSDTDTLITANGTAMRVDLSISGAQTIATGMIATIRNVENLRGNKMADILIGDSQNNVLQGYGANDSLYGGGGNDTLSGLTEDDVLNGDAGNDVLFGGDGNDTLFISTGTDRMDGGTGIDTVVAPTNVAVNVNLSLTALQTVAADSHVRLLNVENLRGSNLGDTLTGDLGDNMLQGLQGDDFIFGGDGNDRIWGHQGSDSIRGDGGNDIIYGTEGNDSVSGGAGNDTIINGIGNDALHGDEGIDTLQALAGTAVRIDLSITTAQATGGAGLDLITGFENLRGAELNDTLSGDGGNNFLYGEAGNDSLSGAGGSDRLFGMTGNDTLSGGDGNDTLSGGDGADMLYGGSGRDVFQFNPNSGTDIIADFENGIDRMDFVGATAFSQLTITAVAGGVSVSYGTTSAVITGATLAMIDAGDFIF